MKRVITLGGIIFTAIIVGIFSWMIIKKNLMIKTTFLFVDTNGKYTQIIKQGETTEKVVALTFDDGPHPEFTSQVLDLLKEHEIKATFFILGKQANLYPELVKREFEEGHELGNHTYSHINVKKASQAKIKEEFNRTQELIFSITGFTPKLFRPPYGFYNDNTLEVAQENNCKIVLWSADQGDWSSPGADKIIKDVTSKTKSGDIVLLHDYIEGDSHTIEALKVILPDLKSKGYRFVTVSELIELSSEQ